jgi:PPM family protein phosphatase
LRYAALSDRGRVRENNEDSHHADGHVFIVADGMGGHRAGEVASAAAIKEFLRFEAQHRGEGPLERLGAGMRAANDYLNRMADDDRELEGMGTTFTAVLIEGGLFLGHVGDSRAYIWREGRLQPMTRDHSLVERMVDEGHLSPRDARTHPQRNVILRALGVERELEIDLDTVDAVPGDRLLLCSDGLSGMLEDTEIESIISGETEPEESCRRLVEAANERGGMDNITAIVIHLEDEMETAMVAGTAVKKTWWRRLTGRSKEQASHG